MVTSSGCYVSSCRALFLSSLIWILEIRGEYGYRMGMSGVSNSRARWAIEELPKNSAEYIKRPLNFVFF